MSRNEHTTALSCFPQMVEKAAVTMEVSRYPSRLTASYAARYSPTVMLFLISLNRGML